MCECAKITLIKVAKPSPTNCTVFSFQINISFMIVLLICIYAVDRVRCVCDSNTLRDIAVEACNRITKRSVDLNDFYNVEHIYRKWNFLRLFTQNSRDESCHEWFQWPHISKNQYYFFSLNIKLNNSYEKFHSCYYVEDDDSECVLTRELCHFLRVWLKKSLSNFQDF